MRFLAPLILLSWWLAWKFQDPYISDWDGFDYTASVVRGLPSPLGLGRALFIGYNHLLWKLLHHLHLLRQEDAYLILRYGSILLSGPAVAGIYALTNELTQRRLAAFFAGILMATSPFFITYSGRSMSEIPGIFLLSWSLWGLVHSLKLRKIPLVLISAALIGLSANVREIAIFYLPFIPFAIYLTGMTGLTGLMGHRWRLGVTALAIAGLTALSGMLFWIMQRGFLYWNEVATWYRLSAQERRLHPVTIQNFSLFSDYAYDCSVAVVILVPLVFALLWPRKKLRPLLILGMLGLLADIVMLINHDLSVNPRYLLTGMIGLVPVCGWGLADIYDRSPWRALVLTCGLAVLSLANFVQISPQYYWQARNAAATAAYLERIRDFPWNSGFIVGARSPLINFYAAIEAQPSWKTISPGAGWPDDKLDEAIDDLLLAGRVVYVDFDPELWQHGARASSREANGLRLIRERYCLRPVVGELFQIIERADRPNLCPPSHNQ
ncbi:MAG: glycosyltransferase family 39 protein [Acidobacteriota bacterium]